MSYELITAKAATLLARDESLAQVFELGRISRIDQNPEFITGAIDVIGAFVPVLAMIARTRPSFTPVCVERSAARNFP
jgi:hypothetical protein